MDAAVAPKVAGTDLGTLAAIPYVPTRMKVAGIALMGAAGIAGIALIMEWKRNRDIDESDADAIETAEGETHTIGLLKIVAAVLAFVAGAALLSIQFA